MMKFTSHRVFNWKINMVRSFQPWTQIVCSFFNAPITDDLYALCTHWYTRNQFLTDYWLKWSITVTRRFFNRNQNSWILMWPPHKLPRDFFPSTRKKKEKRRINYHVSKNSPWMKCLRRNQKTLKLRAKQEQSLNRDELLFFCCSVATMICPLQEIKKETILRLNIFTF